MKSDSEKVEAVRYAYDLGGFVVRKVNGPRGWTKTSQATLERGLRAVLRVILDREPTKEEVAQAGGQD